MAINPSTSVLMSVYNAAPYVQAAVESILQQTVDDFEFVMINDGSSDGSTEILRSYANRDARILLIEQENRGLIASLNRGLEMAHGRYLVRMDADDVSLPRRLEQVCSWFEKVPEADIVGTGMRCFGALNADWFPDWFGHEEIRCQMLFRNALAHPTVALRLDRLREAGLQFDPEFVHAEDYDLWERASHGLGLQNIATVTVKRRLHSESVTSLHLGRMRLSAQAIQERQLRRLGFAWAPLQSSAIARGGPESNESLTVESAVLWLHEIQKRNALVGLFDQRALERVLALELRRLADWPSGHSLKGLSTILTSGLFKLQRWSVRDICRLLKNSAVCVRGARQ
jgi:hypothetical protein